MKSHKRRFAAGSALVATLLMLEAALPVGVSGAYATVQSGGTTPAADQGSPGMTSAPCMSWVSPAVEPRVALLCIHGLGLSSRSYTTLGKRLSRLGVATYAIDVRGFGSWMKAQGHEEVDFSGCLNDVQTALKAIHAAHPGVPVFILGESMGGAIALRAAAMYPEQINGLISSVPAGERFQQKKTDLKVALHILAGGNKQFDIGSQIVSQASTSTDREGGKVVSKSVNEKLKENWASDPLSRMELSPKELMQFQKFMNENHEWAKKITSTPVLFVQGINDSLVNPDGTWELFKQLSTNNRTLLAVASPHLIFEEIEDSDSRAAVVQAGIMLVSWMGATVGGGLGPLGQMPNKANIIPALAQMVQQPGSVELPPLPVLPAVSASDAGLPVGAAVPALPVGQVGGAPAAALAGGPIGVDTSIPGLEQAVQMAKSGHLPQAREMLATVARNYPRSADVRYWLGVTLLEMRYPQLARMEFVEARRLAKTPALAMSANKYLLSIVPGMRRFGPGGAAGRRPGAGRRGGPRAAGGARMNAYNAAAANNNAWDDAATADMTPESSRYSLQLCGGVPTVAAFVASWAEQCKFVDSCFAQAANQYGRSINLVKVDITDPAQDELVKGLNVGPIPTCMFIGRDGTVRQTLIGETAPANFNKAVSSILP